MYNKIIYVIYVICKISIIIFALIF